MKNVMAWVVALSAAGLVAADGVTTMGPGGGGDTCATATVIPSLPYSDVGSTCGAGDDYDEICPNTAPGSPDVVYRYTPFERQVMTISLCTDSDYDTKLYVYGGSCEDYQSGEYSRCNDDACSTPSFASPYVSRIEGMGLSAGYSYYIVIDGYGGDCGTYTLDIDLQPLPECPPDAIIGQDPFVGGGVLANADDGFIRYENFSGATEPICGLVWYGMTGTFGSGGLVECEDDPVSFTVNFYLDDGGLPGALAATRTASLTGERLGIYYGLSGQPGEMQRWAFDFPCVALGQGWFSIQASGGDPECLFVWASAEVDGDGHYLDFGSDLDFRPFDLSFCMLSDASCGDDGAGNCYITNGSPACDDIQCCLTVCTIDDFCCEVEWDGNCAFQAGQACADCGSPEAGDCFDNNGTPGCDDGGCCQTVCILDDFCCNVRWDGLCADEALENCSGPCCLPDGSCVDGATAGDCIADGGTFQLAGTLCSDAVCPYPECPGAGNCYADNDSVGCGSEDCCNIVCNVDPFCCNSTWDGLCASQAAELCGNCGGADAGSCFTAGTTPGCQDGECCETVCAIDPFCCNTFWDSGCVQQAFAMCGCPCDSDGDGDVDVDDLLVILGSWDTPAGDCTGDGVTDVDDLLGVLGQWGACP